MFARCVGDWCVRKPTVQCTGNTHLCAASPRQPLCHSWVRASGHNQPAHNQPANDQQPTTNLCIRACERQRLLSEYVQIWREGGCPRSQASLTVHGLDWAHVVEDDHQHAAVIARFSHRPSCWDGMAEIQGTKCGNADPQQHSIPNSNFPPHGAKICRGHKPSRTSFTRCCSFTECSDRRQ